MPLPHSPTPSRRTRAVGVGFTPCAFEDARHFGRLHRNPCDVLKKAKPVYVPPDVCPLDAKREAALLDAAAGDPFEALYRLALDTGMRQGELLSLTWEDTDFDKRRLDVRRSLKDDNGRLYIGETKTRHSRGHLQPLDGGGAGRPPSRSFGPHRPPIPDQRGGFIRRQNFARRRWQPLLSKAARESSLDFDGFTFHDLRHTCATMLLADGESIAEVSRRLGHSKVSTTLDHYAHALPENANHSADRSIIACRNTRSST
jgi:integrase